jgi:predicted nucleic acid-binding protein
VRKIFLRASADNSKYVFDCSPSIMLLEKCHLKTHLLELGKLYTIFSPERVMEEYAVGDGQNPQPDTAVFKEVFSPAKVELDNELLPFFNYDSSSGEIWVMSYAKNHPEFTCVIDETFARNICNLLGIKVTGTIGIIKELKKFHLLIPDELKQIRVDIKNSHFYLSKQLLLQLDETCDSP